MASTPTPTSPSPPTEEDRLLDDLEFVVSVEALEGAEAKNLGSKKATVLQAAIIEIAEGVQEIEDLQEENEAVQEESDLLREILQYRGVSGRVLQRALEDMKVNRVDAGLALFTAREQ